MTAAVRAIKELNFGAEDAVVVLLPDSIRSYLSKFVDDDWLAANDLLPPSPPITAPNSPPLEPVDAAGQEQKLVVDSHSKPSRSRTSVSKSQDEYANARISDLRLKPVQTIAANATVDEAIELMRDKGFDQVPVTSASGQKLVGLVTLGNCLSYLSSGRVNISSPVQDVMFNFSRQDEVKPLEKFPSKAEGHDESKREFVEITLHTPLRFLARFLEWNAAAIVTERVEADNTLRAKAVVTKVDLLVWLVRQGRQAHGSTIAK